MMKKIFYAPLVPLGLLGLLGACIVLGSCSTGETASTAISQMFGGSSQALLFLNCKAVSENEIEFEFSQPVTVKSVSFEPALAVASMENGSTVRIRLDENAVPGMRYTADLLAEDTDRNTINVLVSFRARNNRMPSLVINELRTEYSKPRAEYIEFKMKSAGNLGAIRVFIVGNYKQPLVYEFLPVEVDEGEYVVLHLRTLEENCKDEYGESLEESGGADSSPTARDIWIPDSTKLLHKTDMIYLLDQDDRVLDAIIMSETTDLWWNKDYFAEAADFLFKQGAWKSIDGKICRPADALISDKATLTRTISRDETVKNTGTAADWYITVGSGATPGKLNNPTRF
jgi:hypothetical protein